jgi:hypothetical protein
MKRRFTVKFETWVDAESPEEAAQLFAEMELKPGSSYQVDVIENEHGKWETIMAHSGESK